MEELKIKILELEQTIFKMNEELNSLSSQFYKNNFSASQVFNKDSTFTSRMRAPVFDSAPSVAEIGDLMVVGGILYICTTASVSGAGAIFTVVGTQS